MAIALVSPAEVVPHEQFVDARVAEIRDEVLELGVWVFPVIADAATGILLDGHHRLALAKELSLSALPCTLVDYQNTKINVESSRVHEACDKHRVLMAGQTGQLLSPKTSKHIFNFDLPKVHIGLERLSDGTRPGIKLHPPTLPNEDRNPNRP